MSTETDTGIRSNFASRLLNKAMSEHKTTGEMKKVMPADAAKYATPAAEAEPVKEAVLTGKE